MALSNDRSATIRFSFKFSSSRPGFQGITDPGDTIAVLVVADVTELHVAQQALSNLNTALEGRVRERTAKLADANRDLQNEVIHREAAEEALRASRHELAVLSQQLMNAQEVERKRIAGELHDSVGQIGRASCRERV